MPSEKNETDCLKCLTAKRVSQAQMNNQSYEMQGITVSGRRISAFSVKINISPLCCTYVYGAERRL